MSSLIGVPLNKELVIKIFTEYNIGEYYGDHRHFTDSIILVEKYKNVQLRMPTDQENDKYIYMVSTEVEIFKFDKILFTPYELDKFTDIYIELERKINYDKDVSLILNGEE